MRFGYRHREGIFYGQCSELCGTNHGYMPIEVELCQKKISLLDRNAREEYAKVGEDIDLANNQ